MEIKARSQRMYHLLNELDISWSLPLQWFSQSKRSIVRDVYLGGVTFIRILWATIQGIGPWLYSLWFLLWWDRVVRFSKEKEVQQLWTQVDGGTKAMGAGFNRIGWRWNWCRSLWVLRWGLPISKILLHSLSCETKGVQWKTPQVITCLIIDCIMKN
jgi:hypothetical protein